MDGLPGDAEMAALTSAPLLYHATGSPATVDYAAYPLASEQEAKGEGVEGSLEISAVAAARVIWGVTAA